MMFGKTSFLISLAGLALLAVPEEEAPAPPPRPPEISGVLAIDDRPKEVREEALRQAQDGQAQPQADGRPAAIRALTITREIPVTRWLGPGEYVWDEEEAAAAGPAGQGDRATVVVNLRSRTLSLYRGGREIGRSSIGYGYSEHPTPLGAFPVRRKSREHYSRTYGNAPMPHSLWLTDDGVAVHGSAELADDLATHGCIGLPREFAALLFEHVAVGDQVIIWSGRAAGG